MVEKKNQEKRQRVVSLDFADEVYDKLRNRGVLFLDGEEVNVFESGSFYRDLFFLAMSGWPKEKPIWVVLNSPGGSADQCFAICDSILSFTRSGYTINVLGVGEVASAAVIILHTGTRRYALENTRFLAHQVRQGSLFHEEEVTQGEERVAEMKRVNKQACAIVAKRTGMDLAVLFGKISKTDLYMSAEDAMKFGTHGLIDEICPIFPFMDVLEGL